MDKLKGLEDECHDIEYKEEKTGKKYRTISTFSNTDGGCLLLGVED